MVGDVITDMNDHIFVAGSQYTDSTTKHDWIVRCYSSSSGNPEWSTTYDNGAGKGEIARNIAIDHTTGDIVVAGSTGDDTNARIIDYEGYPPPISCPTHILTSAEVRTINPAAETPNATDGKYIGFGNCVANGTDFKVEAAFPCYLKESDNSTLSVKIFVAGIIPSMPTTLLFFDSSNNLKFLSVFSPLAPWRSGISTEVPLTTLIPTLSLSNTSIHDALAGTNYWYTLVVPTTVSDDLSNIDWNNSSYELTINVIEIH